MPNFAQFAVIKTGWCDSYTGETPLGNFTYFEQGLGAERYNMLPTAAGFEVYCVTPAPVAPAMTGWTLAHVAVDPAERKMKLVGWYEDAEFLGREIDRGGALRGPTSVYSIRAARAFQIRPQDRPIIEHNHQLGSTRIGWLRGKETATDWDNVRGKLEQAILANVATAFDQQNFTFDILPDFLGDTVQPPPVAGPEIQTDDGGDPFGHSDVAESPEHLALKLWAVAQPGFFDYDDDPEEITSLPELPLPSGDRVDAAHITDDYATLVEVKSRRSGEKDVERGIFQCVKYRAVFEAMERGKSDRHEVNVVLLTENPVSRRLQTLAKRLDVELKQHRMAG